MFLEKKLSIKVSDIEVELIDHMGNDASVTRAARVSFANDGKEFDEVKDAKLINYLAKHGHISPFHHTFITVRVKAPIFVRSQAVKHKFMPVNEVSRRYVSDEPEFYVPSEIRTAVENVKQGSGGKHEMSDYFVTQMRDNFEAALASYQCMIDNGVCAEQARAVLPQSMQTTWYWSGTLSAFADMLRLRLDSHAQKEIQYMAQKIRDTIEPLYPVSLKALLENK